MSTLEKIIAEMDAETSVRYAECLKTSNRINWNINDEVVYGRHFDKAEGKITSLLQTGPF